MEVWNYHLSIIKLMVTKLYHPTYEMTFSIQG